MTNIFAEAYAKYATQGNVKSVADIAEKGGSYNSLPTSASSCALFIWYSASDS